MSLYDSGKLFLRVCRVRPSALIWVAHNCQRFQECCFKAVEERRIEVRVAGLCMLCAVLCCVCFRKVDP